MADQLIAPEELWDQDMVVLVSLNSISTLTGILMAPENFVDYLTTRSYTIAG